MFNCTKERENLNIFPLHESCLKMESNCAQGKKSTLKKIYKNKTEKGTFLTVTSKEARSNVGLFGAVDLA